MIAVTVCATTPVAAQVTGTVYGTIKDEQGSVIPGATLVLTSETRGTKSAPAITNATGDYVFPNVSADTYTLDVTMSGFKSAKRQGLAVSPGDRVAVPAITLEVGGANEMVTVTAERSIIQAQSGERSFTIIPEEVQNLPIFDRTEASGLASAEGVARGGYVLADGSDVILIATGSEVSIALDAREQLSAEGISARVVSMPCVEWFDKQDSVYRNEVLPPDIRARVSVEAGITPPWRMFVGDGGASVGVDRFGASADYRRIYTEFGLTADRVAAVAHDVL